MGDITILIKTFERPRNLRRTLKSIFLYYPDIKIIIADDSRDPERNKRSVMERWPDKNIEYITLPYDVGASEGRNRAWQQITTKYFVVCDDDFIFDHRTDLSLLRDNLEKYGVDLVSGVTFLPAPIKGSNILLTFYENILGWLYDAGLYFPFPFRRIFCGKFRYEPSHKKLQVIKCDLTKSDKIIETDLAPGPFIAKTSIRDRVLWRPELKSVEHLVFLWDFKKNGLKILTNTEVGVNHLRAMPLSYRSQRHNKKLLDGYRLLTMKILNIEILENRVTGMIYKYKNGSFTKEKIVV